jgi:hypothetical protein
VQVQASLDSFEAPEAAHVRIDTARPWTENAHTLTEWFGGGRLQW